MELEQPTRETSPHCNANLTTAPFVIFVCLQVISAVLAICGNLLVLVSIYNSSTLQIVSNYFIASLAVADFLVGILVNPLYIALFSLRLWVSDSVLYKVENFLWMQSLVVVTYSLCAISVDRLLALTRVFSYPDILTEKRARFSIAAVWLFSVAFASLAFIIKGKNDNTASVLWNICTLLTVGLPFTLIAFCYWRIFRITRRQQMSIVSCFPSHLQAETLKQALKNKKAAGTVGIVVGLFLVLFAPNLVFSCVEISTEDQCKKLVVYRHWIWGIVAANFSSVINPFVYAARGREFRAAFKRVLKSR